jgi:hypothetical protein
MGFHLALGLDHKAQAGGVAQAPSQQTDAKRAGIPKRVQRAAVSAQLAQALLGPGQVVGFFARRFLHLLAQQRAAGTDRLRLIQRLGTDLAHMVHPHQGAGQTALLPRHVSSLGQSGGR